MSMLLMMELDDKTERLHDADPAFKSLQSSVDLESPDW